MEGMDRRAFPNAVFRPLVPDRGDAVTRHHRVNDIRQRIATGQYSVPAESVAAAVWRATARAVSIFGRHDG